MNPVKIKDTNKRRRSSTSLSPNKSQNKAAKNALELSNELSGLIERLGDGSVHENELNKSGSVMAEPLISSSQVSNSSTTKKCFLQKNKNLKRRRVFAQIGEYKTEQECDCYIRSTHPFPIVTSHNDFVRCTLCEDHDKHKMSAKYLNCKCGKKNCNFGYRINKCTKVVNSTWVLASGGFHPVELIEEINEDAGVQVKTPNRRPKKKYGIALRIKMLINGMLYSIL